MFRQVADKKENFPMNYERQNTNVAVYEQKLRGKEFSLSPYPSAIHAMSYKCTLVFVNLVIFHICIKFAG